MSTYTQILYQIVFTTKNREKTLNQANRVDLYKFIWGLLKNKKCHLYAVGGVEEHIHLLISLHPSIALSDLVKDIKISASKNIKENKMFPNFTYWQEGYSAFTYSIEAKETLILYIKNQETHHKKISFKEEYLKLLNEFNINYDEKYLF